MNNPLVNWLSKLNAMKAREMRGHERFNDDGSISTHLMANKGNIVHPTLFPNDDGSWTEYESGEEAFGEAIKRNEVLYYDDEEEAEKAAFGNWKLPILYGLMKKYGIK